MDEGLRTSIEAEGYVELAGENKKKNNEKKRRRTEDSYVVNNDVSMDSSINNSSALNINK